MINSQSAKKEESRTRIQAKYTGNSQKFFNYFDSIHCFAKKHMAFYSDGEWNIISQIKEKYSQETNLQYNNIIHELIIFTESLTETQLCYFAYADRVFFPFLYNDVVLVQQRNTQGLTPLGFLFRKIFNSAISQENLSQKAQNLRKILRMRIINTLLLAGASICEAVSSISKFGFLSIKKTFTPQTNIEEEILSQIKTSVFCTPQSLLVMSQHAKWFTLKNITRKLENKLNENLPTSMQFNLVSASEQLSLEFKTICRFTSTEIKFVPLEYVTSKKNAAEGISETLHNLITCCNSPFVKYEVWGFLNDILNSCYVKEGEAKYKQLCYKAITLAFSYDLLEVMEVVLFNNKLNRIDINFLDQDGFALMHYCANQPNKLHFVRLFVDLGADIAIASKDTKLTPLMVAAQAGNIDFLRLSYQFVECSVCTNLGFANIIRYKDKEGNNILHHATQKNREKIVKYIIEKRLVNLDDINFEGNTAFIIAAKFGFHDILLSLLGADVNVLVKNILGKCALDYAQKNGNDDIVQNIKIRIEQVSDKDEQVEKSSAFHK